MPQKSNAGAAGNQVPAVLDAALLYAKAGMEVFPCYSIKAGRCTCFKADCKSPGKHPRIPNGHLKATTDELQIRRWFKEHPDDNIAWRPGEDFCVIDVDDGARANSKGLITIKVGLATLKALEATHGKLQRTMVAISGGGGLHIVCRQPAGVKVSAVIPGDIEVKSHSGYIMVEPSNHISGNRYRWEPGVLANLGMFLDLVPDVPVWARRAAAANDNTSTGKRLDMSPLIFTSAVMAVRNDFDERNEWIKFGCAIHHQSEGSEWGRELFQAWSELWKGGNDPDENDTAWNSFKDHPDGKNVTGAHVIWLAKKAGWRDPREEPVEDTFEKVDDDPIDDTMGGASSSSGEWGVHSYDMDTVKILPVDWVWKGRIARGKLTLIAGDPGEGKSQISLDIAARISRGGTWPNSDDKAPKGRVLILSSEDDVADTIAPRLKAAGANLKLVRFLEGMRTTEKSRSFNLQQDLKALKALIDELGDVVMIIIDPITAYLGDKIDSHKTADVRRVLGPVCAWAAKLRVAVFGITHPPKAAQGKAINNFIASQGFIAQARFGLLVRADDDDPERRTMVSAKYQHGKRPSGFSYKIKSAAKDNDDISFIEWGDAVSISANELFGAGKKPATVAKAENFLRGELGFGEEKLASAIIAKAEEEGISTATLQRARQNLRVVIDRRGFPSVSWWSLPVKEEERPEVEEESELI